MLAPSERQALEVAGHGGQFGRIRHEPRKRAPACLGLRRAIDGRRGGSSYRLGRWQGYQGTDLDATVDLGSVREVRRVAVGFLQDSGAWILLPREVVFLASEDGGSYREIGRVGNVVPSTESGVVTRDFAVEASPQRARYVRVHIAGAGPPPAGHAGEGESSWFFVDEIVVEP